MNSLARLSPEFQLPAPSKGCVHLVLADLRHPNGIEVVHILRPDAELICARERWVALLLSEELRTDGCEFGARVLRCESEEDLLDLAVHPFEEVLQHIPSARCVVTVSACGKELQQRLRVARAATLAAHSIPASTA